MKEQQTEVELNNKNELKLLKLKEKQSQKEFNLLKSSYSDKEHQKQKSVLADAQNEIVQLKEQIEEIKKRIVDIDLVVEDELGNETTENDKTEVNPEEGLKKYLAKCKVLIKKKYAR